MLYEVITMIAGDEAHISAADDQYLLSGFNQVAIDQRLKRTGTVYSRKRVARKRQHFFSGTGGNQQFFRLYLEIAAGLNAFNDADDFI